MCCKLFSSVEQQPLRTVIHCDDKPLENVFRSKYLGTIFTADAKLIHDVKERITQAMSHCVKFHHVLDSPDLSLPINLRLYQEVVCSILTYGCETWLLNPVVMKKINGVNSKMLVRFTGKTIPQEVRKVTCNLDLVRQIRIRRFKWLDHILRECPLRLTYQEVEEQFRIGLRGNILMDVPPHSSLMDLVTLVRDTPSWRSMSKNLLWINPRTSSYHGILLLCFILCFMCLCPCVWWSSVLCSSFEHFWNNVFVVFIFEHLEKRKNLGEKIISMVIS